MQARSSPKQGGNVVINLEDMMAQAHPLALQSIGHTKKNSVLPTQHHRPEKTVRMKK
jgi:hypothetical protein